MALISHFKPSTAIKELKLKQELEYMNLVSRMKIIAEKAYNDAKQQPQGHELGFYNNRTKKLRKSIGVYIFRDGRVIWAKEDSNIAENRVNILKEYIVPKGFTVVIIAGKQYAEDVEGFNYNVLSAQGVRMKKETDFTFLKMKRIG